MTEQDKAKESQTKTTKWHSPIYRGLQLDLRNDSLEFQDEFPLSEEALIIDAVVWKDKDVQVSADIGEIFKGHNIFEFKSEKDSFSKDDYAKVVGYASLYAAFKSVSMTDITITIILTIYPREAVKYLENERGLTVEDKGNGIHYVLGDVYPVQILETKKLSQSNLFLKNLHSKLTRPEMEKTLQALADAGVTNKKDAYLECIAMANWEIFREVMSMSEAFVERFIQAGEEDGWLEKWGKKRDRANSMEIARNLKMKNIPLDVISETTTLPLAEVEAL